VVEADEPIYKVNITLFWMSEGHKVTREIVVISFNHKLRQMKTSASEQWEYVRVFCSAFTEIYFASQVWITEWRIVTWQQVNILTVIVLGILVTGVGEHIPFTLSALRKDGELWATFNDALSIQCWACFSFLDVIVLEIWQCELSNKASMSFWRSIGVWVEKIFRTRFSGHTFSRLVGFVRQ
jgi:hypothetical protein